MKLSRRAALEDLEEAKGDSPKDADSSAESASETVGDVPADTSDSSDAEDEPKAEETSTES